MELAWLGRVALIAYIAVLAALCVYGLHRYYLVLTFFRVRRQAPVPQGRFDPLPHVTVQLPMFNERYVARRIIEQTCKIDYPRHLLEIQVLDDSTDESADIARDTVERLRAAGHDIVYLHRSDRTGYKAGALEEGARVAKGEFIAIFDADFLPPEEILRDSIHFFSDPRVGVVQSRWDHLNRDLSLLTQVQAILLDGHFVIEHTARNRSGRFMSFNGTGGIWRKSAIADAGGWQHDTLTEDLDLSYRAQLKGWKFIFLPDLASPAELPPEMNAFKAQQHRWTKGGAQCCVKLLPKVLMSRCHWKVKLEAFFHLTSSFAYILMVLLALLVGPALYAKLMIPELNTPWLLAFEMLLFFVGFGSGLIFYVVSQRQLGRSWFDCLRYMPALLAVGIGIAFNNAVAAIDGFFSKAGEFVRTPKFGDQAHRHGRWQGRMGFFEVRGSWKTWGELFLGFYMAAFTVSLLLLDNWFERISAALPFMAIFIAGYFYVALQTLYGQWLSQRRSIGGT